jgi:hypothetical protein
LIAHGLRRGLHSCAASRLELGAIGLSLVRIGLSVVRESAWPAPHVNWAPHWTDSRGGYLHAIKVGAPIEIFSQT